MDVIVRKSKYAGWVAMTSIDLPGLRTAGYTGDRPGIAKLDIETYKTLGGIATTARVCFHGDDGGIVHTIGFRTGCGDFYLTVAKSGARATEHAIRRMHAESLLQADALVAAAKAFYRLPK